MGIGLIGTYTHSFDSKGRVSLPSKFRTELQDEELVATIDVRERCLYVFTKENFISWVNSFFKEGFNPRSAEDTNLRSILYGRAADVKLDSAGRITVPAEMREKVGITKDAKIIGGADCIEIWDAKRRDEEEAKIDLSSYLLP